MMDKLIEEVQSVIEKEYARASAEHGRMHNSDHEAYAVTLEELDEAAEEIQSCWSALSKFWEYVKENNNYLPFRLNSMKLVQEKALLGACELIQVAAMAYKAQVTIKDRMYKDKHEGE